MPAIPTGIVQPQQLGRATPVSNSRDPAEGPQALEFVIDFSASATYNVDLTQEQQQARISNVQTLYLDNSKNNAPTLVSLAGSGQPITIPAGAQAYIPIIAPSPAKMTLESDASNATAVFMALLNVPMPFAIWFPFDPHTSGSNFGTDHSVNAPAAGANVITLAANPGRENYIVQNQSAETIQVWYSQSGTGGTCILLASGGAANTQGGAINMSEFPWSGQIDIKYTTAGDQIAVREI